ncbi:DUF433 domain-containing protein [Coleofasciculus sp. F4-SAH-05]|uniref:DUF433 domain-containing protein n=1 Tax=Coleofasciculus sp. F4-SAH-05 TaxID=3069525 RepID=UPI0033023C16
MKNWQEQIEINPKVCHGKPCIKGTRIDENLSITHAEFLRNKGYDCLDNSCSFGL